VSGTSRQLAEGRAMIVTGGRPEDVGAAEAVLAALSPRRRHAGPLGDANRTKLAINLVLGLNRAALAEGLVLAGRMGLDADAFLETLRASAAHSAVMDVKGGMMVRGDFTPQGRVAQSAKDFALILAAGGGALPLAGLYADLMQDCLAHGEADLDNAAVIRAIRRRVESGRRRGGDG
jgi:3-hydroxyisobutyrate dehydrogenase-like beta-hydroxyacid dehydrogenase